MLLHKNVVLFNELINATESKIGLLVFQIEKDHYVSLFLKELNKYNQTIPIVFKGGTSLSKCYNIINRFSEDIDISLQFTDPKKIKKIIKF